MENGTNASVNSAPAPVAAPAPSNNGGFWKGFFVGVVATIATGIAVTLVGGLLLVKSVDTNLSKAQANGALAAVKSNLSTLRADAEISYDADGSYAGTCQNAAIVSKISNVKNLQHVNDSVCNASAEAYAVAISLRDGEGAKTVCVDSTGRLSEVAGLASERVTGTACPL